MFVFSEIPRVHVKYAVGTIFYLCVLVNPVLGTYLLHSAHLEGVPKKPWDPPPHDRQWCMSDWTNSHWSIIK